MTIDFQKMNGLVPAIVQDVATREVLMLGYMNEEAFEQTQSSGFVTFWSRSKERLWQKGETSGNVLKVCEVRADCDQDAILVLAEPQGPTCHTGIRSCFGEEDLGVGLLSELEAVIRSRKQEMPEGSYTTSLYKEGLPKILEKVEEESDEVIQAAQKEGPERLAEESGDLLYHLMVLLAEQKISLEEVFKVLRKRRG